MTQTQNSPPDADEQREWMRLQNELINRGFSYEDVYHKVLEKAPHTAPGQGSGLMQAAHVSLAKPIQWSDLLWCVGIVLGVGFFLKLVGMAFNIGMPLGLHTATPVEEPL